jgi:hypothetical protein
LKQPERRQSKMDHTESSIMAALNPWKPEPPWSSP